MHFQKIIPAEPLREFVRYFWIFEDFTVKSEAKTFKILPDGLPALIFQEEANLFLDNTGMTLPQLSIFGQSTRYTEHRAIGDFRLIGVYLEPTALKTIFNLDAFELNNKGVALEDIVSEPILEQLLNTVSIDRKIELLSTLLLQRIQNVKQDAHKAKFASRLLQEGRPLIAIQQEMNLSERSLERLLKQHVGVSPKMFARIMRFQSSLNAFREINFKNLTDIAYTNDYFDQSHYIREFKEFTGASPTYFLQKANEQLTNFPQWT